MCCKQTPVLTHSVRVILVLRDGLKMSNSPVWGFICNFVSSGSFREFRKDALGPMVIACLAVLLPPLFFALASIVSPPCSSLVW